MNEMGVGFVYRRGACRSAQNSCSYHKKTRRCVTKNEEGGNSPEVMPLSSCPICHVPCRLCVLISPADLMPFLWGLLVSLHAAEGVS